MTFETGARIRNPPRVSRTMSGRRSCGGCCEAEATHTPASSPPREGSTGDVAPQVCSLQPLPFPTWGKLSLKHEVSRQSCVDLLGRCLLHTGLHGCGHMSWVTPGPHNHLGPQKGNAKQRYHRDAKNAGAAAEEVSEMTPYVSLFSGGKNVAGPCPGLRCHPRLPRGR